MEFEIEWRGQKYSMEWLDDTDFESLENVTQVYGFVFDEDGKFCIVDCDKGRWTLPGGGPEDYDDSFEDTFIREIDEEADLDIKNIKRLGCFKVTPISDNCEKGTHYITRFIAEVDRVKGQTIDPAVNAIPLRKFIKPEDFLEFVNWGDSGAYQLERALEVFGKSG